MVFLNFYIFLSLFLNIYPFDELKDNNTLYVGQSLRINAQDISKITVVNSQVIKVKKDSNDSVLITAKRIGSTSIYLKNKEDEKQFHFTVMSSEVHKRLEAINEVLKNMENLKTTVAGEYIYIRGVLRNEEELQKLKEILNSYKKIINLTTIDSLISTKKDSKIVEDLLNIGLYDVSFKRIKDTIFINASARNSSIIEDANFYIKKYYPNAKFNIKLIPYQVDIDIKIVELSRSEIKNLGIDFPGSFNNITSRNIISNIKLDSIFEFAENKGAARILSNPSLSANDREKASFHVGGSLPIKLSTRYTADVNWKNYGVMLNFIPKVISDETVELVISSEFSSMDSNSESEIPGFSIKKVDTVVTLDSGKTVIISGLIDSKKMKSRSGFPGTLNIPIISSVFSSNNTERVDSEIAVIVTPYIRFRAEKNYIDKKLDELLSELLDSV